MPKMISTQIEIAASPATVREKLLDFSKIPIYSPKGFIRFIEPLDPGKPIVEGEKLTAKIQGASLIPTILENSATSFRWRGKLLNLDWLFVGTHGFHFNNSHVTPGHTTFVQDEFFGGVLSFLFSDSWVARMIGAKAKTMSGFTGFNADLKAWAEKNT